MVSSAQTRSFTKVVPLISMMSCRGEQAVMANTCLTVAARVGSARLVAEKFTDNHAVMPSSLVSQPLIPW